MLDRIGNVCGAVVAQLTDALGDGGGGPAPAQGQTVPARRGSDVRCRESDLAGPDRIEVGDHRAPADPAAMWLACLREEGLDAFMDAWKGGLVDKSVFEDKEFGLALQNAVDTDSRYWQMMSNIQAARSRVLDNIAGNLRA